MCEREECEVCEKEVCVCLLGNELRQLQKLIMSDKVNYDTNVTLDTPAECLCVVCVVCRCVCVCCHQICIKPSVASGGGRFTGHLPDNLQYDCQMQLLLSALAHTHAHSLRVTHTHSGTVTLKVTVRWELTKQSSCLACTCCLCVLSATEATPVGCCCRVSFFPCRAFATARRIFMN